MTGGVTRRILPHLSGVPHLLLKQALTEGHPTLILFEKKNVYTNDAGRISLEI